MEEIDRTGWIETVVDQGESWLVNSVKSIPKSQVGGQASQVQEWIEEGGVVEVIPPPDPLVEQAEAAEHRMDNRVLKLLLLPLVESKPEEEQETFSFLFPA